MHMQEINEKERWNASVQSLPGCHLLQSWQWGELKARYGWKAQRLLWMDAGGRPLAAAQVLQRRIGLKLSILYCPRGPLLDWSNHALSGQILQALKDVAHQTGSIFIKIDPPLLVASGDPEEERIEKIPQAIQVLQSWEDAGWKPSPEQIQFRNTMIVDLTASEEDRMAGMKQKTRYNVRLGGRRGVVVRLGSMQDLPVLYKMYAETSLRDGFVIRSQRYYLDAWGSFIQDGLAQPLIAEVDDVPVAGIILFRFGSTAWYMYGMSTGRHRDKMPNYALQWEAMRWAQANGCRTYDFWGAPDVVDSADPMYGVYRFKAGFGARFIQGPGAWDYVRRPGMAWIYHNVLPRILAVMRRHGNTETRQALQ